MNIEGEEERDLSLRSAFSALGRCEFGQFDSFMGTSFFVLGMGFDGEDGDVGLVRPIGPEKPTRAGRVVLKIRLEDLDAVFAAQVLDFMGSEAVVLRVFRKVTECFDEFLEEFLILLIEVSHVIPRGEIQLKRLHFGDSHADLKWHRAAQPF